MTDAINFLPTLLEGALVTIVLTLVIMAIAIVAGFAVALLRRSSHVWVRVPLIGYVEVIRGTPLLVQLYYIFYVLPFLGVTLPGVVAGILGMSLCYAAYLSEVFRASISAIPRPQIEAGESLGLSYWQLHRLVIVPQAARIALPPTVNYLLGLFKDTSLLSIVTVQELMFKGFLLGSFTYQYFIVFTEVAVMYFIICYPWAFLSSWLERRLRREDGAGLALQPRVGRLTLDVKA